MDVLTRLTREAARQWPSQQGAGVIVRVLHMLLVAVQPLAVLRRPRLNGQCIRAPWSCGFCCLCVPDHLVRFAASALVPGGDAFSQLVWLPHSCHRVSCGVLDWGNWSLVHPTGLMTPLELSRSYISPRHSTGFFFALSVLMMSVLLRLWPFLPRDTVPRWTVIYSLQRFLTHFSQYRHPPSNVWSPPCLRDLTASPRVFIRCKGMAPSQRFQAIVVPAQLCLGFLPDLDTSAHSPLYVNMPVHMYAVCKINM